MRGLPAAAFAARESMPDRRREAGARAFGGCVLAYFAVTMSVAYPWHMLLFHEQYAAMGAFTRAEPILPLGMTAVLVQGVVFAYLFPLYLRHRGAGRPVRRGMEFGLLFGSTVYSVMVFATAAKFEIEPVARFLALGTAFQLLQFLLVGATIGWIHARRR